MTDTTLRTPLYQAHIEAGAKMTPFAGWMMPVQYRGILEEHHHTRRNASVFDICHMGEFLIHGNGAAAGLDALLTHAVSRLATGRCGYGFLCNDQGGVLDDLIVYRLAEEHFMLVVNAACIEKDKKRLRECLTEEVVLEDVSANTAKIDLQGPASRTALNTLLGGDWRMPYFSFVRTVWQGNDLLISRTGYTGEFGFEIYCASPLARDLWDALLGLPGVLPAGLGARDTLRLEAGLPLYGHELDEAHTPVEAGFAPLLARSGTFPGREHMDRVRQRLIGLSLEGRQSAREKDPVLNLDGSEIGYVTSASFAPTLGHSVALAYVDVSRAEDEEFRIQRGKKTLSARKTSLPFYTGTARDASPSSSR